MYGYMMRVEDRAGLQTILFHRPSPSLNGNAAVRAKLASHASSLARGELGHAAIDMMHQSLGLVTFMRESYIPVVRVIHVVVDGINTGTGAGITASRAAAGGGSLSGGVRHAVAAAAAATLEGMVETDPVTGLMSQSLRPAGSQQCVVL